MLYGGDGITEEERRINDIMSKAVQLPNCPL
jgi:hypothetical protein